MIIVIIIMKIINVVIIMSNYCIVQDCIAVNLWKCCPTYPPCMIDIQGITIQCSVPLLYNYLLLYGTLLVRLCHLVDVLFFEFMHKCEKTQGIESLYILRTRFKLRLFDLIDSQDIVIRNQSLWQRLNSFIRLHIQGYPQRMKL